MRLKSYFSRTVEQAMALAAQELGPEAMLLNSRKAPPEARHLGEYEVIFATDVPGEESSPPPSDAVPPQIASPDGERLAKDMAELKKELEGMRRAVTRSIMPAQLVGAPQDLSDAYAALIAGDVPPDLAREIVERAEARLSQARPKRGQRPVGAAFDRALMEELESRFTANPALGVGESRPSIVALVGPPGAGKSTTLVKLAVNYGLASRRPVVLFSMDTYRVAAADQLRCFAGILGVGCQVLETVAGLAQAIEENRGKELILIDTPGFGFQDMDSASGLAQFLSTRGDIDTHLVVSASMKSADLSRVVDGFEIFRPQYLLFTKLDETISFGPLLAEAARTGKPVSFFTTGQRIPEDIEAATRGRLIELVLMGGRGEHVSAA
jgi:flagellar biosynthesis protein FlhF